jgi:hypothetical protein
MKIVMKKSRATNCYIAVGGVDFSDKDRGTDQSIYFTLPEGELTRMRKIASENGIITSNKMQVYGAIGADLEIEILRTCDDLGAPTEVECLTNEFLQKDFILMDAVLYVNHYKWWVEFWSDDRDATHYTVPKEWDEPITNGKSI